MGRFLAMGLSGLLGMNLVACGSGDDGATIVIDPVIASNPVTVLFDIEGFTAIQVGGPFQVSILQGSEFSVEFTVSSTVVDVLDVELVRDVLQIGFKNGANVRANRLEVVLVMPALNRVSFAGATTGFFSGFEGSRLEIDLSGACFLEGLNVDYDFVDIQAIGASQVLMQDITAVPAAHAELVGASSATISMMDNGTLTGSLLGASALFYFGNQISAQVSTDISSTVTRLGNST